MVYRALWYNFLYIFYTIFDRVWRDVPQNNFPFTISESYYDHQNDFESQVERQYRQDHKPTRYITHASTSRTAHQLDTCTFSMLVQIGLHANQHDSMQWVGAWQYRCALPEKFAFYLSYNSHLLLLCGLNCVVAAFQYAVCHKSFAKVDQTSGKKLFFIIISSIICSSKSTHLHLCFIDPIKVYIVQLACSEYDCNNYVHQKVDKFLLY